MSRREGQPAVAGAEAHQPPCGNAAAPNGPGPLRAFGGFLLCARVRDRQGPLGRRAVDPRFLPRHVSPGRRISHFATSQGEDSSKLFRGGFGILHGF